ncbi:nucleotidyltransferase domain-containing protein [Filibacter tadaridae]|uniref:Nucleotidyltransferase domain protein n=1 Tax=Filibacter tadaridae TaxID=2483811 RepID=A0A3P5X2H1_9BACL|nr:nucleotidyltransferase domain-containing protein [Filibacter tadaridae]VDC28144.1 Nucleotidyltransferase domain protein [Filibacter tadaridae]
MARMNDKLVNQLQIVANRFPAIETVLLFGSRAHGDYGRNSDIDLAVKTPGITDNDRLAFSGQVENEMDTLLKIDLKRLESASSRLRNETQACYQVIV